MKLPRALAPWARQLQIFPDEISFALGAMARSLAPLVAPLRSPEEISNREPNGYDGVNGRGIYERLLLSELALADEMPEEFVRRAVMGEHLFLNLARVAPAAKRFSVALFDAGSDQSGTPRVAHLAALIVLARRAESVKADFSWGVLQDAELKTFHEVTESNVSSLLAARTARNAAAEHVEKWREKLNVPDAAAADIWLVGAPDLKNFELAKCFSVLSIEDVLEPNARQLQISVKSASGAAAARETILELPDESVCTRLLRNPFEIYAPPEPLNLTGNLSSFFFDDHGGKIFARGGDAKSVLYISVPNSPNAATVNPRRYRSSRANEILLAAGRLGKSVVTVSLDENGHLRLDYPKFGNFKLPAGSYSVKNFDLVLPKDDKTLLPIYNLRYPNSPFYRAAILDAKSNLIVLHNADNDDRNCAGNAALMAADVLAAARLDKRFVYVGRNPSTNIMEISSYGEKPEKRELPFPEITAAFFGRAAHTADKIFGLLALGDADNRFAILTSSGEKYIDATAGSTVVGVFQDASFAREVGLVELEEDRRTLNFNTGGTYIKQIFAAEEEIVKIVFSHRRPVFAYQTESGKVVIFSLAHRTPIGTIGG